MSDVDVKIGITVVDAAAKRALGDLGKATDDLAKKADGAGDKASASVTKIGKAAKTAGQETEKTKGFFEKLSSTIKDDLGNNGSSTIGNLSNLLSGTLVASIGVATIAAAGLKTAFDLTLAAERNEQIGRSFEALAQSAGLAGDSLRNGLAAATKGLADDDAVLEAANRAIVLLGSNAAALPQTMELARKATALFGGDLIQNFDALNNAIATGNTRLLRQFGIVLNADEAQAKYAASIGTTADRLNDAGQRQAIMNAALEAAQQKFQNVDETSNQATQSFNRLKTSLGECGDAIAEAIRQSGFFSGVLDGASSVADSAANTIRARFGDGVENAGLKAELAVSRVTGLEQAIASMSKVIQAAGGDKTMEAQLAKMKEDLAVARIAADDARKALQLLSATKAAPDADKPKDHTKTQDPAEVERAVQDERTKLQAVADARSQMVTALREGELITEAEHAERKRLILEESLIAETALLDQRFAEGKLKEENYYASKQQLAEKFALDSTRLQNEEKKREESLTKLKETQEKQRLSNMSSIYSQIATLQDSSTKELFYVGKAAALANAYINGQEAISKAWAVGGPFGGVLAAATAAAVGVNIANIAGAQFGSAGGGGSTSVPDVNTAKLNGLDLDIAERERRTMEPGATKDAALELEIEQLKAERDRLRKDMEIERLRKETGRYATGGIVPGSSYSGDRVVARVNSGEMILNDSQQAQLFKLANGQGGNDRTLALVQSVLAQPISIQIDGREIINVTRSQLAGGRSFS